MTADQAEALLQRLAPAEGVYEPLYGMCVYCKQGSMLGSEHSTECPWQQARRYLTQHSALDSAVRTQR